jgi:hypothetical protein
MPDAERLVTGKNIARSSRYSVKGLFRRRSPASHELLTLPDCRSNMDGRQGWIYVSINHFCFYSYVMGEEKKIVIPFTSEHTFAPHTD